METTVESSESQLSPHNVRCDLANVPGTLIRQNTVGKILGTMNTMHRTILFFIHIRQWKIWSEKWNGPFCVHLNTDIEIWYWHQKWAFRGLFCWMFWTTVKACGLQTGVYNRVSENETWGRLWEVPKELPLKYNYLNFMHIIGESFIVKDSEESCVFFKQKMWSHNSFQHF